MEWKVDAAPTLVRKITDPIGHIFMKYRGFEESKRRYYDMDTEGYDADFIHGVLVRKRNDIEEVKNNFLNGFAWRTMAYVPAVVVVVLFLHLLSSARTVTVPVTAYGSSIQVIGGIILGRGLISGPVEIVDQAGIPYGGISSYFAKALATDAADGIWGITLILLGASIAGLSTIGVG